MSEHIQKKILTHLKSDTYRPQKRRGLARELDLAGDEEYQQFKQALSELMRECLFSPTYWGEALYVPPFAGRFLLRLAAFFERLGGRFSLPGAGVHIVEATKQVYRPIGVRRVARQVVRPLEPVLAPVPAGLSRDGLPGGSAQG